MLFDIRNIVIVIVVVFVIVIIVVVTRPGILPRWGKFRAWLFKLSGQLEDMYILYSHLVMPGQSVISVWFIFFRASCSGNMFVQASDHVQAMLFDIRNIVIVIVVVYVIGIIVVVTRPVSLPRHVYIM